MAKRFYFCSVLGDGTEQNPYHVWFQQQNIPPMQILDMRPYPQIEDGFMVVWGEISDAAHALAIAELSVTYIPFEDGAGNALPLTATVGDVSAANRAIIQNLFTAHGVPVTGIVLSWTIAQALQLVRRRMVLALMLGSLDFDEPNMLLSAMPTLRLKAIRRALTNSGFDVSGITLTMTQAQAISLLAGQGIVDTFVAQVPGLSL